MTVYAEQFGISQTKVTANIGETVDLDLTGTDKIPRWTSYNVNIAKVNQDGEVTAVRKGKTTISARIGLSYKKCTVTVVDSSIKLNKKTATIYTGGTSTKTVQLKATVKGASKAVAWSSDNPNVATVNEKGKVTSVAAGTATITATANGKTASCVVTVKESGISLNMNAMQLSTKGNGSSIKLTPTVVGSKKSVRWTTSDKRIATVSGGKVTGKKNGTATITATANGVSATCEVTVIKDSISINTEKELLYTGESKQLKTNASKKDVVVWSSSDESVATVIDGKIKAVGAGKSTISVERDGITDTCEITVKETSTSIKEKKIELRTKGTDKTYTLNFEVIGRKSSVKWATSNKAIATVNKGKITAKKAGTITITATANGVSDSVQVTVKNYDPTIKLNQSEYTLYTKKGNALTLKATVDGVNKKVTWKSSDDTIATVNNKGKVTAKNEGQALITATANGVTAECLINVRESKVILETKNITLDKGEKAQIPADVVGYSQAVKYVSTNSKIVTVKNGTITAKKYGEADIKVTANGITEICHVKVAVCEHAYDAGVITKEPSCTEMGIKTFTCTLCKDSYTEDIPLAEHSYVNSTVTEPTCEEQGYTIYSCSCGESYKDNYVNALDHDWGEWKTTKEPTETKVGEQKRICNRCSKEEKSEIPIKTHEHIYVPEITEATCEEQGYTTYICGCGHFYIDNYVDVLEHKWGEGVVIKEASCSETGTKKFTCVMCNNTYYTEEIPVTEHKYEDTVTEPTCTEQGYTEHSCNICGGGYYVDAYVDALGCEAGEWEVVRKPTCTLDGWNNKRCIRCKTILEQEEFAELGHSYEWVITKAPTCTENGIEENICLNCNDSIQSREVGASHTYNDDWTITKEPSDGIAELESDFGARERSCTVCKEVQHQSIVNIELSDGSIKQLYGEFRDDMAYETFVLTNELRKSLGLNELVWLDTDGANSCTKIRAAEISYYYEHTRPNGENVAWGENISICDDSAEYVMNRWKNSSGHYKNLVNSSYKTYNAACFIVYHDDAEVDVLRTTPFWVQIFTSIDYTKEEDSEVEESVNEETSQVEVNSVSEEVVDTPEIEETTEVETSVEETETEEFIDGSKETIDVT